MSRGHNDLDLACICKWSGFFSEAKMGVFHYASLQWVWAFTIWLAGVFRVSGSYFAYLDGDRRSEGALCFRDPEVLEHQISIWRHDGVFNRRSLKCCAGIKPPRKILQQCDLITDVIQQLPADHQPLVHSREAGC